MSFNFLKKFFYCFAAILLRAAIIHCQETLYAQEFSQQKLVNQEDLPEVVVMPWRTIGIDASIRSNLREEFIQSQQSLASALITDSESLTRYLSSKQNDEKNGLLTQNMIRLSDQIYVGRAKSTLPTPMAVEPVLCSLLNTNLVFLTFTHAFQNILIASSHYRIGTLNEKKPIDLKFPLSVLLNKAVEKTASAPIAPSALKIGFSVGQQNLKDGEESALCLNLLLEEKLASQYRIVKSIGNESLVTFRNLLNPKEKMQRATRRIIAYWRQKENVATQKDLIKVILKASFAESVFANHIPLEYQGEFSFAFNGNTIDFQIEQELNDFLNAQKQSLDLNEFPKIAHINRAWIYLDKGRAWGLKINDRLISQELPNEVQGHVVGYFGPEMNLKSQYGHGIVEGAIVYIRKGQKKVRVGQTFIFDRKTYPTPWPPQKTK